MTYQFIKMLKATGITFNVDDAKFIWIDEQIIKLESKVNYYILNTFLDTGLNNLNAFNLKNLKAEKQKLKYNTITVFELYSLLPLSF